MSVRATTSGVDPDRRAVAILPARLASTRLPRKMLLDATGLPLIVHSARNVLDSGLFARVVVAADAPEIVDAARANGIEVVLTRADHPSGTDRVNECFAQLVLSGESARVVVGVQGDEPEILREDLARLLGAFDDTSVEMATLSVPIADDAAGAALFASPSVVKVVCDARGDALYFSRAAIPARGHAPASGAGARRHVGVYAFTPQALVRFCGLPRGVLEQTESLEQLRWLENGGKLRVVAASQAPQGIDTRADYDAFVARTAQRRTEQRPSEQRDTRASSNERESTATKTNTTSTSARSGATNSNANTSDRVSTQRTGSEARANTG